MKKKQGTKMRETDSTKKNLTDSYPKKTLPGTMCPSLQPLNTTCKYKIKKIIGNRKNDMVLDNKDVSFCIQFISNDETNT